MRRPGLLLLLSMLSLPAWAQQQPVFPRHPAAPRTCDPAARGFGYFNTTTSIPFVCDGSTWVDVTLTGSGVGAGDSVDWLGVHTFIDGSFSLIGSADPTKRVRVQADSCAAGTTCELTVTANTTVPIASQPITLAGPAAPRIWTGDDAAFTIATRDRPNAFTSTVSIVDGSFSLLGSGDPTKVVVVEADGLGSGTTATVSVTGSTTLPIFSQPITFIGPTEARIVTLPNQAFSVAGLNVNQAFTGANVSTGRFTFGAYDGAPNSVTFDGTTGCVEFEGAVEDAFEYRLCMANTGIDMQVNFPAVAASVTVPFTASANVWANTNTFGLMYGFSNVEAVTTTKLTASGSEGGETYTNTGDTDGATITLANDPTAGSTSLFAVTVAQTMTIVPSAGESLYLGADQCVVSITSNTIGSTVTIRAVIGASGGRWYAFGPTGTWVCNDV